MGHISRCMALAELLSKEFETTFITRTPDALTLNVLEQLCDRVIILDSTPFDYELSEHLSGNELVVLDGYHFSTQYEQNIKDKSAAVITIDDIPQRHFVADAVINFCGAIDEKRYSKEFYTQLYLGAQYVFLRPPFLRKTVDKSNAPKRLLINMGGADPTNETRGLIHLILSQRTTFPVEVVVGQNYAFSKDLSVLIKPYPFIVLHQSLNAVQMFEVMSRCTIAILPPSTVALEFLSTGGILFLKKTAENQACILKYLLAQNAAFSIDNFSTALDEKKFNPAPLFQGGSLESVWKIFQGVAFSSQLRLRKMQHSDMETVYQWASDRESRRFSYSKTEITWEGHVKWFTDRLTNSSCYYFLVEIDNSPVGQIRFDQSYEDSGTFTISYLIDANWRGKGLGTGVLVKGIQKLRREVGVRHIIGFVQISNIGSVKAFDRAGFQRNIAEEYSDSYKFELSFEN